MKVFLSIIIKITDLANATSDDNAVNLSQLKSYTDSHQNNYHIQKSFTFSKNFGDDAQLIQRNSNIPNHNHHGLLIVSKEGFDSGLYGEAWVSLKMTNNLPPGIYTAVFASFSSQLLSLHQIISIS